MRSSTVRSPWLSLARAYGIARGVEVPEVESDLDARAFECATHAFANACGDRHLGVSLAWWIPRGTYRLVEYAARNAPTLIESMRVAAAYAPLMNDRLRMRVVETRSEIAIEHWIAGEPSSLGRHFDEFAMATAVRFIREVTRGLATVSRVHFVHDDDDGGSDADSAEETFGATVRRGQERNAFVIPATFRDCTVPDADPALAGLLDDLSRSALRAVPPSDIVTQARVAIASLLDEQGADIASVARVMGISVRTLERRLHDEHTTFERVRDAYRRDRALQLIRRGVRVPDVARRLRFRSMRGFMRAMDRWGASRPILTT